MMTRMLIYYSSVRLMFGVGSESSYSAWLGVVMVVKKFMLFWTSRYIALKIYDSLKITLCIAGKII